jgi:protein TonB
MRTAMKDATPVNRRCQRNSPEAGTRQTGVRAPARALDEQDLLSHFSLTRPEEKRIFPIALCAALVLHALCIFIDFPESTIVKDAPQEHKVIVVRKYIPPPPKPQRRRSAATKQESKKRIPIPDPTPDYPEPIVEPEPYLPVESLSFDGELAIGDPVPPPAGGYGYGAPGGTGVAPVLAGVGGVTNPVRIEECWVRPEYPDLARAARVSGEVILRAIILCNGAVAGTEVLRCTAPGFGFEESAVAAVEQWRYLPATQDGTPVAVYFTIIVEFDLV